MDYHYVSVSSEEGFTTKHLLRQIFINSGIWMAFLISGLAVGTPTVAIAQLQKEGNSTEAHDIAIDSWISSIWGFASLPWIFILCWLANAYGRRLPQFLVAITSCISFLTVYFGSGKLHLLISEAILGTALAACNSTALMVSTESSSAKYRGIFLSLKTVSSYGGIWIANAIGTFFHYKIIALLGLFCSLHVFAVSFWSESPFWLASQERYEECAQYHRWLKGTDKTSEIELQKLISSTKSFIRESQSSNKKNILINIYKIITLREFYTPTLLGLSAKLTYHCSGKLVCNVYAIQIIKRITQNDSAAYIGMLLLDGIAVIGMIFGSIMSRYLKRRTLLLWSSWTGEVFLFTIVVYTLLINRSIISENNYVTIALLAGFSISLSLGLVILQTSLLGELMPLKYKSLASCIAASGIMIASSALIKIGPYMFKYFDAYGTFLCYGLLSTFFLLILQKYLPEIKDKTLQDIEQCFKKDKSDEKFTEEEKLN